MGTNTKKIAAEDQHRDPVVACLGELLQVGAGDGPDVRPVQRLRDALVGGDGGGGHQTVLPSTRAEAAAPGRLPHGEVEVLERRLVGLDPGDPGAGGGEREHEVGHALGRVEAHDGGAVGALVADHAGRVLEGVEGGRVVGAEAHHGVGPVAPGELAGRAVDEVGAVLEHDDLVGEALGLEEQVGAHHDGRAVVRSSRG